MNFVNTRTMSLSKTSEVDSTSKEKALMPYWNELCLETSQRLLSHTETGCVGSDLNALNPLQINTIATSWFSTKARVGCISEASYTLIIQHIEPCGVCKYRIMHYNYLKYKGV